MRKFETGATRNKDDNKFDHEAFNCPAVDHRYGEYMHKHRIQADGSMRDGDNWQHGIPEAVYLKSLVRHVYDLRMLMRGWEVLCPDTGQPANKQELLCAIRFNANGLLHEDLKVEKARNTALKNNG